MKKKKNKDRRQKDELSEEQLDIISGGRISSNNPFPKHNKTFKIIKK